MANPVTLPKNLEAVGDAAFSSCSLLTTMVIPETVTQIGAGIVPYSLRSLYFLGNAPVCVGNPLNGSYSGLTVYVIRGTKGWDGVATSRVLPETWNGRAITSWTPNQFDVVFDANGGEPATYTVQEITDNSYAFPKTAPTMTGYDFAGWWTERDGGAEVKTYTEVTATKGDPVVLTLETSLDERKLMGVSTGGDADWTAVREEFARVGGACAKSGAVGMDQRTWLEATVSGKGELTFYWRVSCEHDGRGTCSYDHLVFTARDARKEFKIDGVTDWIRQKVTFDTEGEHTVRWEEVVREAMDVKKGAVIDLLGGSLGTTGPTITTAPTHIGLTYTFREGTTLEGLGTKSPSATKSGDGEKWSPKINVKGGNSAFYSIVVGKGE